MTHTLSIEGLKNGQRLNINGGIYTADSSTAFADVPVRLVKTDLGALHWIALGHSAVPDALWRSASVADTFPRGSDIGQPKHTVGGLVFELKTSGDNRHLYQAGSQVLLVFKKGGRWNCKRGDLIASIS